MIDTLRLTAEEAKGLLERGEVSGAELRAAYREAIDARNEELHCFLTLVDGDDNDGVPIALKDVISTKGVRTTAGSRILENYVPVVRLDGCGALQGRRIAAARQDEHGRVRDGIVHRELRVRPVEKPVGSDARPGRFRRGVRGGRVGRPCSLGSRFRHRRVDQAAGRALRQRRAASDVRDRVALRHRRVRLEPRPGWARHEDGARQRAALRDHQRTRRVRFDDGGRPARRASRRQRIWRACGSACRRS